ncbi:hypothetical protein [Rhizobium ruizarguesonis]|uniref:hypothetical protein n=1 Tax=Rhizobium ruizarguesonis TaxID=2081791 RepID=UPI0013BE2196|nr:hypothetical protein [Rhizobium ruizarguesonis]NEH64586.1 hypothetical protein [Rhizobium ruizarguesonis]NEH78078.1 hypothetical protein [Rhizobium ruizarguesonis]NEI78509.1 hypothetical protein [Rhizobium ruizarguesonis]
MAGGFVEQATLSIDDKASKQVRSLNKDISNLIRNAKRLNGLKFDVGGIKQAQSQVRSLAKSINSLPKSKTVNVTVNQTTRNRATGPAVGRGGRVPPPPVLPPSSGPGTRGGVRGNMLLGFGNDSTLQTAGRIIARAFTATIGFDLRRLVDMTGKSAGQGVVAVDTARLNAFVAGIKDIEGFEASARSAALSTSGVSAGDIMAALTEQVSNLQVQLESGKIDIGQYNKQLEFLTTTTARTTQAFGTIRGSFETGANDVRQIFRSLPLTNAGLDTDKQGAFIKAVSNAIAASGGDLTGDEVRRTLQQLGTTVAQSLSPEGLARVLLIRDEGGRQSTGEVRTAIQDLIRGNLNKADKASQIAAGLRSRDGTTRFGAADLADPVAFAEKEILPRVKASGIDPQDSIKVSSFIDEVLGFTTSGSRALVGFVKSVEQNRVELERFRGTDIGRANNNETLVTSFKEIETSFQDAISKNSDGIVSALKFGSAGLSGLIDNVGSGKLPSPTDLAGFAAVGVASALQSALDPTTRPLALAALALDGSAAALTASAAVLSGAGIAAGIAGAGGLGATGGIARGTAAIAGLASTGGVLAGIAALLKGSSSGSTYMTMSPEDRAKARAEARATYDNYKPRTDTYATLAGQRAASGGNNPLTNAVDMATSLGNASDNFKRTFETGAQGLVDSGTTAGTNFTNAAGTFLDNASAAGAAFGDAAAARISAATPNIVIPSAARSSATPPNVGAVATPTE